MCILNMHRYPRYSQILKDDFDDTQESSGFSPPAKLKVVEDKASAAATPEQQQTTESANGKELGTLQWQNCIYCNTPKTAVIFCAVCGRRQPNSNISLDTYVA